ncbi:hypothetical protein [uncultured Amphritea sp.]|uniref:hypothetical protein n=1 Tax=uncultured Amphritea sp. TaxID=981605 RepID=UPI002604351A|nr:hypothetical protein [uncultured Amphritea sp.]
MNLDDLQSKIDRTSKLVLAAIIIVPLSYLVWFVLNGQDVSTNTSDWGTFGDFIGGVLNPFIAFFAFYWLTQSIQIQKQELAETKEIWEASSQAQKDQAELTFRTLKVQALNSQLEYVNTRILAEREYINQLLQQATTHGLQYTVITKEAENKTLDEILPPLNEELAELSKEQENLVTEIQNITSPVSGR